MRLTAFALALGTVASLAACKGRDTPPEIPPQPTPAPAAVSPPAPATAAPVTDEWIGQWIGPEGTLLVLSKLGSDYDVKIQSLDGPNNYTGKAAGDHIEFERGGKIESIRAGDGADTGMKWLAEKKDCLVIQSGEGFCRD